MELEKRIERLESKVMAPQFVLQAAILLLRENEEMKESFCSKIAELSKKKTDLKRPQAEEDQSNFVTEVWNLSDLKEFLDLLEA